MANEINVSSGLSVTKDGVTTRGSVSTNLTLTGSQFIQNIQSVGTSYEQITFGDMDTCKYVWLKNNSTASIQVSNTNSDVKWFATLSPGYSIVMPPSGSNSAASLQVYVKSSEASADLQVVATEY